MKDHLTRNAENSAEECNCRDECPLDGKCNTGPMIYKATITAGRETKTYIGSTQDFKQRIANHKQSFRNPTLKNATTLSKYVWDKGLGPSPNIDWTILAKTRLYEKGGGHCDLCLSEKLFILLDAKDPKSLNKRTDLSNKCAHKMKFRLHRLK